MGKKINICIPSSCGGHLKEVLLFESVIKNQNVYYILNDKLNNKLFLSENNVFFITHIENYFKLYINFIEAYAILKKIKPQLIISTGASPAVVISIISKFFYNSKIVFLESITRIKKPSRTARIMYYLSDVFIIRNISLKKYFPKAYLYEI